MDIRSAAYNLCKLVKKSPNRQEVKTLIESLNRVPQKDSNTADRSHFGYIARGYKNQILGYIIVDEDRERIISMKMAPPLSPLQDSERQILNNIHKQILALNDQCLIPIKEEIPQVLLSVKPYNEYEVRLDSTEPNLTLFSLSDIVDFAKLFHTHPSFLKAKETLSLLPKQIPEDRYPNGVLQFIYGLENPQDKSVNDTLAKIDIGEKLDSPARMTIRHFASLACIRSSLQTLNQLLFQALLEDQLPKIHENNIIDIEINRSVYEGSKPKIIYQPDNKIDIVSPGELVFIDYSLGNEIIKGLFRVEQMGFKYSKDLGTEVEVVLRDIDENLNPFYSLLQI